MSEDGFISEVSKTGHGLQRAFLLAILQYLASVQERRESLETASEESNAPDLVLAIEEPELYQHPNRQRHFARVLAELASAQIPGAARRIQVLYCTHSPLFVGIDRFNRIRLLKKIDGIESRPKTTKIVATNLESVARRLDEVGGHDGRRYTPETLLPQLRTIMNPWMNEGFFAQVVVLVEGETDRAAILGVANAYGHDFEQNGIAVVPCGGKNNIDRPAIIFSEFGIATYLVWDGDFEGNGARPSINRELLRLVRSIEVDWPEAVEPTFACFKRNLETTLRQELGDIFWDTKLSYYRAEYDFDKNKDALKNPVVIEKIIEDAHNSGKECVTLNNIVHHIWEMRSR